LSYYLIFMLTLIILGIVVPSSIRIAVKYGLTWAVLYFTLTIIGMLLTMKISEYLIRLDEKRRRTKKECNRTKLKNPKSL